MIECPECKGVLFLSQVVKEINCFPINDKGEIDWDGEYRDESPEVLEDNIFCPNCTLAEDKNEEITKLYELVYAEFGGVVSIRRKND